MSIISKNNWFNTNLSDRLVDKQINFCTNISPYPFRSLTFDQAADLTCIEIYQGYPSLYLALSGGLDSEFVLRCFHKNKIPITPVIVSCGNSEEIKYAFEVCKELNTDPVVIDMSEEELVEFFRVNVVEKLNGIGYNSVQGMKVVEFVSKIDDFSMVVSGQHIIGDGEEVITDDRYIIANEWDFYADYFLPVVRNINFFTYTQELTYALMPGTNIDWNSHKSTTYKILPRNKMRHSYTYNTQKKLIDVLKKSVATKRGEVWTKQQFLNTFKNFKEN